MDLIDRVTDVLHGDRARATAGLAVIMNAVRFSLDAAGFAPIEEAFPWVSSLPTGPAANAARTAEIFALVDPADLPRRLEQTGLTTAEIDRIASLIATALSGILDGDTVSQLGDRLPLLATTGTH